MKFTLDWLKDHLDTDRPLADIVEKLSMIGLEVEGVEDRAAALASFRVAQVVSAEKHPDADRLKVCMVDCGDGNPIQVVCGAPNARAGMKGVFAASGAYIPGIDVTLKKSKIRGQDSNGMLLSEREMGLSEDHEGIVELPEDAEIGSSAVAAMGLSDPVIEIGLTPNRQDCAGIRGIARDLAAAGLGTLKPLDAPELAGTFAPPIKWQRDLPDGTNYVTFDLSRPLHVFDAAKVSGDVTMRLATDGETVKALDGAEYTLDGTMIVIADDNGVEAIGGVMGGEASELTIAGDMPAWQREVHLRKSRVAGLGGLDVPGDEQMRILADLGFAPVDEGETIRTQVPSWRQDIDGEADLVEEVLRIRGYDNIPVVPLPRDTTVSAPAWSPSQRRESAARRALAARGMTEAVTFSFMKRDTAELFGFSNEALVVDNPISADLDVMRPSILPNLLDAARRNADRGYADVALFEVGPKYSGDGDDGQAIVAAGIRTGQNAGRHWAEPARPVDAWDAKADALAALEAAGAPVGNLQVTADAPPWYHPGRSGVLRLGPNALASFGDIHPGVLRAMDIDGPAVGIVVNLHLIPVPKQKKGKSGGGAARPLLSLSPFQPVHRDFAFVVEADVAAGDIVRAASGADKDLITDVSVFDLYVGEHVAAGQKSVAIAVTLQPVEATLTDARIDAVATRITAEVQKRTGGVLRG